MKRKLTKEQEVERKLNAIDDCDPQYGIGLFREMAEIRIKKMQKEEFVDRVLREEKAARAEVRKAIRTQLGLASNSASGSASASDTASRAE